MHFDLKKPCQFCPFRKTSLPSYLGSYKPEEVIQHLQFEIPFFCHTHMEKNHGYDEPDWKEWLDEHGQICAGSMVMMTRLCKLPRMREWSQAVQKIKDCPDVFKTPQEFLTYHERRPLPKVPKSKKP